MQHRNVVGRLWQAERERGQRIRDFVIDRPILATLAGALLGAIISLTSALQDSQHSPSPLSNAAGGALASFLGVGAVILLFRWIRKIRERRADSPR